MALDKQQLLIELRTQGVTLTKNQLKQLDGQVKASKAGMIAMGVGIAAATAAIYAFSKALSSTIRVGKDFQQSLQNLKAISNASSSEMLKLESTARKLGASTKFTASEVSGLQTEFAKLGFTIPQIQNATEATLDLAAATGADLAEAAAIAGQTVRAFGLTASETLRVTDVMAQSFSSSALDMQKFTDSMSYVAPVAKMAGFSIEGTTAIIGTLANAGVSGSMAGTALRRIFLELSNESSKLSKRLGGPISSVEELIPAMERLKEEGISTAEMKDLVGQRAISAFSILLEGVGTVDKLTDSLDNAAGAAGRMADTQLDSLEGKLTILNSAWEGFGIAVFDYFKEPMEEATESLTGFLQTMTGAIEIPLSEKMNENRYEILGLMSAMNDSNISMEMQKKLAGELATKFPDVSKQYKEAKDKGKDLKDIIDEVNDALMDQIIVQAATQDLNTVIGESSTNWLAAFDASNNYNKELKRMEEFLFGNIDASRTENDILAEKTKFLQENSKEIQTSEGFNYTWYSARAEQLLEISKAMSGEKWQLDKANEGYEEAEIRVIALRERLELLKDTLDNIEVGDYDVPIGPPEAPKDEEETPTPTVSADEYQVLYDNYLEIEDSYAMTSLEMQLGILDERREAMITYLTSIEQAEGEHAKKIEKINATTDKKKRQLAFKSFSAGMGMMVANLEGAAEAGYVSQSMVKAASTVNTLVKTYESAQNAYNSMVGIPVVGPALAAVAAAAAVAAGMASLAQVKSVEPEKESAPAAAVESYIAAGKAAAKAQTGGLLGGKPHSQGGTMIEAEKGEYVIRKDVVNRMGPEYFDMLNFGRFQEGGMVDVGEDFEGGFEDTPAQGINITFSGNVLSRDFVEEEVVEILQDFIRRGGEL